MRFQVPQFIEVEDKIFGPFTLKQFIYMAGGVGMSIVFWTFLPLIIALIFIVPILSLSAALAFLKINDKPFIHLMEAFYKYSIGNKLYIWRKEPKKFIPRNIEEVRPNDTFIPKLSESKLKDLTWKLDIKENLNPVTRNNE